MRKSLWLVLCLVCTFATDAHAGKKKTLDNARILFKEGTKHFKNGEYAEAAESFRAAHRAKPNWKLLYNIAQSEAAAKRHGMALTAFERYLALGGDDVVEARQDEVEKEIARLKKMVGYVSVEAPEGAAIFVDGVECGLAPIAGGIPVSGSVVHFVKVMLPTGEELPEKKVSLVSGNKINISFIEKKEAPPAPLAAPPPETTEDKQEPAEPLMVEPSKEEEEKGSRMSPLELAGWIAVGTGGAMLITAGVTGGLAIKENNYIEDHCPDGCYEADHDRIDKRDMLAMTTDVLIGVGSVVAATGAGLLIFSFIKNKKERESENTVWVRPVLNPQVAGASLEVRF